MRTMIGLITFGKYFDSSNADFEELLQLNIKGFTDIETIAQNSFLDFFPVVKYFPVRSYQSVQELMSRIFEILGHQLMIQEKDFDPTAKIDSLTGSLLKERIAAENVEAGAEDEASILSDEFVINTMEDMFGAGYETTSTTLRWTIAYLVHHTQWQTEMQNQLDEVVGRDRLPGLDDICNALHQNTCRIKIFSTLVLKVLQQLSRLLRNPFFDKLLIG